MKSQKPGSERDGIRQMMCCLEKSEVGTEKGSLHLGTKSCFAGRVSEGWLVKSQNSKYNVATASRQFKKAKNLPDIPLWKNQDGNAKA